MQKLLKKISVFFMTFAITLSALMPAVTAYAADEERCSITVSLSDLGTTNYAVSRVTGSLYRIGDADVYGLAKIYDEYGGMDLPQEADETEALIKALVDAVSEEDLVMTSVSDGDIIKFSDIDTGIYFITFTETEKYGEIMPAIVNLPFYENNEGVMSGPFYNAKVEPKASTLTKEDNSSGSYNGTTTTERPGTAAYYGDTPSDKNRGTVSVNNPSFVNGLEEDTDIEGTGTGSITPGNTGETIPVWVYALICLAAFGAIGIVVMERRQRHE